MVVMKSPAKVDLLISVPVDGKFCLMCTYESILFGGGIWCELFRRSLVAQDQPGTHYTKRCKECMAAQKKAQKSAK